MRVAGAESCVCGTVTAAEEAMAVVVSASAFRRLALATHAALHCRNGAVADVAESAVDT